MSITYRQFRITDDHDLLLSLVECYRDVFADPPWNEDMICPACQRSYGRYLERYTCLRCEDCDVPLKEFWPVQTVIRDLEHELTPSASCWLAMAESRVIGFSWRYPITVNGLEAKLELSGIANALHQMTNQPAVSYLDEIGVIAEYRGRGIARQLYDLHVNELTLAGNTSLMVARTKKIPPTVVYHWFTRIGYRVVARYSEKDGRVILAMSVLGQT